MTREHPILFSGDMVRAILAGNKTQTRRVMKPQSRGIAYIRGSRGGQCERVACPHGVFGDHLWVREAHYVWNAGYKDGSGRRIDYRATEPDSPCGRWTPSIHMPRWASRITLEITDVRVERLQSINDDDALAEGIYPTKTGIYPGSPRAAFRGLWDSLNAKRNGCSWDQNPYVWVISFRRLS